MSSKLEQKYFKTKSAKVGETCNCPSCGSVFVKQYKQQAFCVSKKGTKCKDFYWNNITPTKKNNTTRISPRNAMWQTKSLFNNHSNIVGYSQAELDKIDRLNNELNFEGGGQGGNVYVERCDRCGCIDCRCESYVSLFD